VLTVEMVSKLRPTKPVLTAPSTALWSWTTHVLLSLCLKKWKEVKSEHSELVDFVVDFFQDDSYDVYMMSEKW